MSLKMNHSLTSICTIPFLFSFLLSAVLFFVPFSASAEMPSDGVCAHRGDNACFPENTVPAFLSAAEKGAAMVEMDVKRCKTGELVIMHDPTVDRTTTGTGKVADLTFAELRSFDAGVKKDPKFAGTCIPTFDEAVDGLPKDGIWINIHCGGDVALEVAQKVKEKGRLHQAFLATQISAAEKVRETVPEMLICNMTRTGNFNTKWTADQNTQYANLTIENRCSFLQLLSPCSLEDAKALHEFGVKINYFFCNDPEKLASLLEIGVDFPLTDRLDVMKAKYEELKK